MVLKIIEWIVAYLSIESTIILWRLNGRSETYTLLMVSIIGTVGILITYGFILGGFRFLGKIFEELWKKKKNKGWYSRIRRKMKLSSRFLGIRVSRFLTREKGHLILFSLNLIPLPYFTPASIIAVKIARVRYGIFSIMAGNLFKVFIEVYIIYRI